jgi:hypothetical protein
LGLTKPEKYGDLRRSFSLNQEINMDDWTPPELEEFTGKWTVAPSLSGSYIRFTKSDSVILRAAALGLIFAEFVPAQEKQKRRFMRTNGERAIQDAVIQATIQMPHAFVDRLLVECRHECERLLDWLDRIEGQAHPAYEVRSWLQALRILIYACKALRVHGRYVDINRQMLHLEHEWKKRLPQRPE